MSHTIAVVVAAGGGLRAGREIPKQYVALAGRPLLMWSVEALTSHPDIERVYVAIDPNHRARAAGMLRGYDKVALVEGGPKRSDTVRLALEAAADDAPDAVLIHDAARPGLTLQVVDRLLDALKTSPAAAPALKIVDAVKRETDASGLEDVDRTGLHRIQTPQAFDFATILAAHQASDADAVDDLAVARAFGVQAVLVDGEERLMKVTYQEDFAMVERFLSPAPAPRTGSGYDVHAFGPGDAVQLCGVSVPHTHALQGHSDADVGWHALTDALLGALAAGDIGDHFPPGDPQWKGAPSSTFLSFARDLVAQKGFRIANVDITLICEAPRIGPHRETMRRATADLLTLDLDAVSIKATTTEKLGFTGRGEGIAAQAVAMLVPAGANGEDA